MSFIALFRAKDFIKIKDNVSIIYLSQYSFDCKSYKRYKFVLFDKDLTVVNLGIRQLLITLMLKHIT